MLSLKLSWIYIYVYRFRFDVRGFSVFYPVIKEGRLDGDYHTIVWLCFYVVIGRNLHSLRPLTAQQKEELNRCA